MKSDSHDKERLERDWRETGERLERDSHDEDISWR